MIDYSIQIANYGYVPYGKTLYGQMVVSNPIHGCDYITNTLDNDNAIFIVDRTTCSFVDKSFFAQIAKGRLLVIIDFWESNENERHYDKRTDG